MTRVLVNFIQDRSGSMSSVWSETLNGFKVFVEELQRKGPDEDVDYLLSLTVFDTLVDMPIVAQPISEVDTGLLAGYGPRGATALYDAVGQTLENVSRNRHDAEKIICVIVTDGHENSSREWSKDALQKTIERNLDAGDWTFTYLGTQPETWDEASRIGIGVGATASYQARKAGDSYQVMARSISNLASSAESGTRRLMSERYTDRQHAETAGLSFKESKPDEEQGSEDKNSTGSGS